MTHDENGYINGRGLMGFIYWDLMGFNGVYWDLIGFNWIYIMDMGLSETRVYSQ